LHNALRNSKLHHVNSELLTFFFNFRVISFAVGIVRLRTKPRSLVFSFSFANRQP
jgi:hypothetical protein